MRVDTVSEIFLIILISTIYGHDAKECLCNGNPGRFLLFLCPTEIKIITKDMINNCSMNTNKVNKLQIVIDNRKADDVVQLDADVFIDYPNITHLNLSGIGLVGLKSGILTSLSKLSTVDLSHNRIQFIPSDIFKHYVLRDIDLNYNRIKYLDTLPDYDIYSGGASNSSVIKLLYNPVQCHCINRNILTNVTRFAFITEYNRICESFNITTTPCNNEDLHVTTSHNLTGTFYKNVLINCTVKGPKLYSVVWESPNGTFYANQHYEPWIDHNLIGNRSVMIEPRDFYSSISVLHNNSLIIRHFRGFFYGDWKCLAFVPSGKNFSSTVFLSIESSLPPIFLWSLIFGACTSFGLLIAGILVGFIHLIRDTKCFTEERKHTSFKHPFFEVIPVPSELHTERKTSKKGDRSTDENYLAIPVDEGDNEYDCDEFNVDVELVFKDENMAKEYVEAFDTLSQCKDNPSAFRAHLEDVRSRLRRDVGPKLKIVRTRVRRATEDSRNRMQRHMEILRNFNQESRDRMQRKMDVIKANSSEAANKMRASFVHVKEHMKSVAELCGSVHLGQTISLVSVQMNANEYESNCLPIKEYYFE